MSNSKAVGVAYSDPVLDGAVITNSTVSGNLTLPLTNLTASTAATTSGMAMWGAALTTAQLAAITTASLSALTTTQLSGFTTTQVAAYNTQLAAIPTLVTALKTLGITA